MVSETGSKNNTSIGLRKEIGVKSLWMCACGTRMKHYAACDIENQIEIQSKSSGKILDS